MCTLIIILNVDPREKRYHNMMVLHHSLCTVLKSPVCRGTAYISLFLIQSCRLIGVGVARLEEPVFIIEKSSNLPDDKNDFPYVLFLIKELLFFIDTKCVIYLFVLRRSSWSYLSFILVGRRFHRNIPTLNGDHKWQKKNFFRSKWSENFFL